MYVWIHACICVRMFACLFVCTYVGIYFRIAFSVDTPSDMSTCVCETNISAELPNAVFLITDAKPDFDKSQALKSTYQINTHQQTWVTSWCKGRSAFNCSLPFVATLWEAAGTPAPLREVPKKRWHSAEPEWRNANRAGKILEDSCGSGTSLMDMILGPTQAHSAQKTKLVLHKHTDCLYYICLF